MNLRHYLSLADGYDDGTRKGEFMEPPQIHFLDMPTSEAIEVKLRERVESLERFSSNIQRCEVWISSPHGHHRKGRMNGVRVRLTVPGGEIDIDLQPAEEDVYVSIREAFDAAKRKLEDYERQRRGTVKTHPRSAKAARGRGAIPETDATDS